MAPFLLLPQRMISRVHGAGLSGIEPFVVTVETDIGRGLPKFDIVGLAQSSVQEGRNRILSALRASGVTLGPKRITVNLAPAAVRKEGASLDLTIALGLLSALEQIPLNSLDRHLALGELSLDGTLRPIRGAFAYAWFARQNGWEGVILPGASAGETSLVDGIRVVAPGTLTELIRHLRGESVAFLSPKRELPAAAPYGTDWSEVGGQGVAKRALEIAAAGGHNIVLGGSPGVGKTLLARRFPTILPPLAEEEALEVRRIFSAAGYDLSACDGLPPFRSPHHQASMAGMVGGGKPFRPGEFTLAHRGVLFLDEMPEFRRDILESLRQPLEEGVVTVCRLEGSYRLPSRFLLVGAMNLCPCGALGDPGKSCLCSPPVLERYRTKVSGPIRDRIDLFVELPRPAWRELWDLSSGERSSVVRERVLAARKRQELRNGRPVWNAFLTSRDVRERIGLLPEARTLLERAMAKMGLSARSMDKVLKVARTIADLEGSEPVVSPHVAEALQYRATSTAFAQ